MRMQRIKSQAACVMSVAVLAACGGGGGSSEGSSGSNAAQNNSSGQATTSAAVLLPTAASAVALSAPSGDATADGELFLNATRQTVGLPAIQQDSRLATASLDHSTYLVDNVATGHYETAGLTGFTGTDPFVRMEALGTFSAMGEVVVAGQSAAFTTSATGVQLLFDAPFHRVIMLGDYALMGVSSMQNATWEAVNIDFANSAGAIPANALVAYPYANQQDAPATWFASESPNPFASQPQYENTMVGYPVEVVASLSSALSSMAFKITDATGNDVPCLAQTPQTSGSELTNGAFCVPYAPLATNANYSVHVTGTLTSGAKALPIDLSWTFHTGTQAYLMHSQGVTIGASRPVLDAPVTRN